MSKKKKISIISIICLVAILGIGWFTFPRVSPKFSDATIELGDTVSEDITDYLDAKQDLLNKAVLDVSEVDTSKVGTYPVHSKVLFYEYDFQIEIVDTVAPEIEVRNEDIYLEAGKEYPTETFIKGTSDLSGDVQVAVIEDDERKNAISFDELGEAKVTIEAKDASGNSGSVEVKVLVDEAPIFVGLHDRHIELGKEFDVTKNIVAIDNLDGILTERIEVESDALDVNTIGQYDITYTVVDNYGLEKEVNITIYVCNADELAQYQEENVLTEEELTLLCDNGYFTYEPLKEDNYEKTLELVHPTLIDIGNDKHGWGSGFIYKITPEYIYFLTGEHVAKKRINNTTITFFDNTKITESFKYIRLSKNNELSMFRIPIQDIPIDTLIKLKQVYIDTTIYEKLNVGDNVFAYAVWWEEKNDIIKKGTIKNIMATWDLFGYYFENSCIETTPISQGGMSGTGVFDYKGNLLGAIFGRKVTPYSGFSLRIDEVETLWERRNELD